MRIAFVVNQFPALSQTFVLRQITGLLDRGHEVDIFAYSPGKDPIRHPNVEKYGLLKHTYYLTACACSQAAPIRLPKTPRAGLYQFAQTSDRSLKDPQCREVWKRCPAASGSVSGHSLFGQRSLRHSSLPIRYSRRIGSPTRRRGTFSWQAYHLLSRL